MRKILALLITVYMLTACTNQSGPAKAELPAGKAFAENQEIYFVHTEASDPEIAETLTNMMKSPVFFVPSLADIPDNALANVYVFTNGITGTGPLGFQADVFDNPPGTPGYTPLRRLNLATWVDEAQALELQSAAAVQAAQESGQLKVEQPGVVINMPFVVWNNGNR